MVEFRKTSILSEFEFDSSVALPSGSFVTLAQMKVPAQQIRFWGNGHIVNGVDDRGILKLTVKDSNGNVISGTARLMVKDANGVINNFRRADRTEDLSNGVRVGKDSIGAKQDSYLVIEFKADADSTADMSKTELYAPITIRTL